MDLYLACAAGVIVSIILPILSAFVRESFPAPLAGAAGATAFRKVGIRWDRVWVFVKPYLGLGVFSLLVASVLVAFLGDTLTSWKPAFLAGYLSDATLQKIINSGRISPDPGKTNSQSQNSLAARLKEAKEKEDKEKEATGKDEGEKPK